MSTMFDEPRAGARRSTVRTVAREKRSRRVVAARSKSTARRSRIETDQRVELIDLTERVMALVRQPHIHEGIVTCSRCTRRARCSSTNTRPRSSPTSRRFSSTSSRATRGGCTTIRRTPIAIGMNADSHLRAMMLGHSLTLQVSGGEVVLGQWQRILMAELDGPRTRTLAMQRHGRRAMTRPWRLGPVNMRRSASDLLTSPTNSPRASG